MSNTLTRALVNRATLPAPSIERPSVEQAIRAAGAAGISKHFLARAVRSMRTPERMAEVNRLIEAGLVGWHVEHTPTGGRPTTRLYWLAALPER